MEFRPDGTVLYYVGREANFREAVPGEWEFNADGLLVGTWELPEDGILELKPQPLFVPTPLAKGRVGISFDNSSGRDTLNFAGAGQFGRKR
jgi:hypothetical protein